MQLGGKPLIGHAVDGALAAFGHVIVSTDDEEIAECARQFGADVPFERPAHLASDTASELAAWQHAIEWVQTNRGAFECFVSVPTTSPLREVSDLTGIRDLLLADERTDVVVSGRIAERNPWFNMVRVVEDGFVTLAASGDDKPVRRQDAPELYDLTTVGYAARVSYLESAASLFDGNVRLYEVPAERALDIDTRFDFEIAQFLLQQKEATAGTGGDRS